MDQSASDSRGLVLTLRVLGIALVVVACLRIAWVSDDALITLRTALNITHGWGPGFNATEAVQAYTHPLWFLSWITIGVATNQWILGILALSIICTGVAVGLLLWRTSSPARLILVTGLLLLSNAFVEYATSGLENPLSYLTVGALMAMTFGGLAVSGIGRYRQLVIPALAGLLIAAILLTRLDLAVLIAPAVVLLIVDRRRSLRPVLIAVVAAVVPLAVWFAWSQATYGSLLPNTFLAKRNVDIPASELIVQGLRYLWVTFEHDPVTMIALTIGIAAALIAGTRFGRAWAIGALLYISYVVWVGGDFMAGRFLAVPLYVAVFLIATLPALVTSRESQPAWIATSVTAVAILAIATVATGAQSSALTNPQAARWEVDQNINAGVSDERGVYVANGRSLEGLIDGLSLAFVTPNIVPIGDSTGLNRVLRDLDKEAKEWPSTPGYIGQPAEVGVFCGFLGTIGMATGPITHLIDPCALTDRFLAAKPFTAEPFAWKPGHFERQVPAGYVEAIQANDPTLLEDPREEFLVKQLWSQIRPQQK